MLQMVTKFSYLGQIHSSIINDESFPNSSQENSTNSSDINLDSPQFLEQGVQTDEEEWEQKIVEAILNALPLKHQQGDSIKSFEDWLKWAKD